MKASQPQETAENNDSQEWIKTPVANLLRYKPSGIYFARVRVKGKLFRQSLKTNVMSVAKLKLAEFIKDRQEEMGDDSAVTSGKMTVTDARKVFENRLEANQGITEGAKVYRRKCVQALFKSWPELADLSVGKISKDACIEWARKFSKDYSATVFNNTVGTLRMILDIAVEKGARTLNPARFISKRKIKLRKLDLPEPEQFEKFITEIETAGAWCSNDCADLVRFLAYGGFRKTEAACVTWNDCDFTKGQIHLRITKNGEARYVPMIPEMRGLLERLKAERPEDAPTGPVMLVKECQKAMDRAAKKVGFARITHHDLRHLFATRCIESGVDIPTVSRWMGHKDGGALAMKIYGHLRDHHSTAMAQRVSFSSAKPENVVELPNTKEAAK